MVALSIRVPSGLRTTADGDHRRVHAREQEVRVVEDVEDVPPELEPGAAADGKRLVEAQVRLGVSGSGAIAAAGGAVGAKLEAVQRVGGRVDDLLVGPAAAGARLTGAVQPLATGIPRAGGSAVQPRNGARVGGERLPGRGAGDGRSTPSHRACVASRLDLPSSAGSIQTREMLKMWVRPVSGRPQSRSGAARSRAAVFCGQAAAVGERHVRP